LLKTTAFYTLMILFVLGFAEGSARVTDRYLYDTPYDPLAIGGFSHDAAWAPSGVDEVTAERLSYHVLHPYLGFVMEGHKGVEAAHGFSVSYPPEQPAEPGTFSVLLTGGSVAAQVRDLIREGLTERLAEREGRDVPVRLFGGVQAGYKQPQQLMTLTYLLSVGAEFDLVINLDGYNDIALTYSEIMQNGIHPTFPRMWQHRIDELGDVASLRRQGQVAFLRERKDTLAQWAATALPARSAVVGLFVTRSYIKADRRIASVMQEEMDSGEELSFEASGPPFGATTTEEQYKLATELWMRSSILMHRVSRANGMRYVHVLQPNQYFEGTKPLSRREREKFFTPHHAIHAAITDNYETLLKMGEDLRVAGIEFVDATRIFETELETMYIDPCCHFNEVGKKRLADFVVDAVLDSPAPQPRP